MERHRIPIFTMTLTEAQKAEVRATLDAYGTAYSKKDLRGMMALLSPGIRGFGSGPDEVIENYGDQVRQLRRDMSQATSLSVEFTDVKIAGEMPVAWIMTRTAITFTAAGSPPQTMHGRSTMVMRNTGSRWLVEQFHFAMPYLGQAEGQSFPGT